MKTISRKVIYTVAALAVIAGLALAHHNHSQRKALKIALTFFEQPTESDYTLNRLIKEPASVYGDFAARAGGNQSDIDAYTQALIKASSDQLLLETNLFTAKIMVKKFSIQELMEMSAFENSAIGKALDARTPKIKSYFDLTPEEMKWVQNLPQDQSREFFSYLKSKGGQAYQRERATLFAPLNQFITEKGAKIIAHNAVSLLETDTLVRFETPAQRAYAIEAISHATGLHYK